MKQVCQVKIRIDTDLRRRLARSAKRNKQSINKEMTSRLQRSILSDEFWEFMDPDTIIWRRKKKNAVATNGN